MQLWYIKKHYCGAWKFENHAEFFFLHQYDLKRHQNSGLTESRSLRFPIYRKSHVCVCRNFLMSHFVQKVVLSAWPWQIYPFAPCSFFLHSLLMTNVKRISPLHESSHSTRTKRVSRMAVIQSVSKLSDTHLNKESMSITCRAEGWVRLQNGISCFLSWSLPVAFVLALSLF